MSKRIDLAGKKFGRLTVVEVHQTIAGRLYWNVLCDCGARKSVRGQPLVEGRIQSCGCWQRELTIKRSWKHGHDRRNNRTLEYNTWASMRSRCLCSSDKLYPSYGGRGITICARWAELEHGFENFFADMGPRPPSPPRYSIERKDNNKGYDPENCVWGTRFDQMRNTRRTRRVFFHGEELCLKDAAEKAGLDYKLVHNRINKLGWSVERALTAVKQ